MKIETIKANYRKSYKSKKLNVAAYVRVSTAFEKQIYSFESQRKYYISKIYKNSNWNYVGLYEDFSVSGKSTNNRNGFNKMIEDALDGKIDLILTKSVSRFSRNTVDALKYIRMLREKNVGILFEEENIYTLKMESEMLLTILSSVAQQESDNISSHIKKTMKMNLESGKLWKRLRVYGYKFKNGKIKIDEKEALIVKRIYNEYINGESVLDICKRLNEEKVKPPTKKVWDKFHIYFILKRKIYIGIVKCGELYNFDELRIVTDDISNQANKILLKNGQISLKKTDKEIPVVRCGFCGRTMSYSVTLKDFLKDSCRRFQCKYGSSISIISVNKVLLDFQNEL